MSNVIKIGLGKKYLKEAKKLVKEGKRIQAIKLVRANGTVLSGDRQLPVGVKSTSQPGLKEAKYATDNLDNRHDGSYACIVPNWEVHSVIVTGHLGTRIELNLENLQMYFLTSLETLGLEEVARLMELVDYIKKWQGSIVE
jgi:hypothetical protein